MRAVRFPLGDWEKGDVRRKAAALGLPAHDRPDSQDLCFLADGGYRTFLRRRCPQAFVPGPLVHVSGSVLGTHDGLGAYTVGQRRGIGIAWSAPLYVVALRPGENTVVVGEHEHLFRKCVRATSTGFRSRSPASLSVRPCASATVIPAHPPSLPRCPTAPPS